MRKNSILILNKSDEKIIPIVKFLLDNYMNTMKVINVTNESKDRVLNHYPTSYVHETLNDDISGSALNVNDTIQFNVGVVDNFGNEKTGSFTATVVNGVGPVVSSVNNNNYKKVNL